jgi:hypothetical protein
MLRRAASIAARQHLLGPHMGEAAKPRMDPPERNLGGDEADSVPRDETIQCKKNQTLGTLT